MVNTSYYYKSFSLDSLVQIIDISTTTLSVWTFQDNATFQLKVGKRNYKGQYKYIADNCEFRLGKKKKTPEGLTFHILLIDERHLIMTCTKPKAEFVYLCRRN
jgi:hypothetical protein